MKCPSDSWEELELLAFSEDKLEPRRAALLAEHLGSCFVCRAFVEQQRAVWQALDAWEAPAVAADFDHRLYSRLEQDSGSWTRWLEPLRFLLVGKGLPIAAAACLIVIAGLVAYRPAPAPATSAASAAHVETLPPEQVEHALDDLQMLGDFTRATRADTDEL